MESFTLKVNNIDYSIKFLDNILDIKAIYYENYSEWRGIIDSDTAGTNYDLIDSVNSANSLNLPRLNNSIKPKINIKYNPLQMYQCLQQYSLGTLKSTITLDFPKLTQDFIKEIGLDSCLIIKIITTVTHIKNNSSNINYIILKEQAISDLTRIEKLFSYKFSLLQNTIANLTDTINKHEDKISSLQNTIANLTDTINKQEDKIKLLKNEENLGI